MGVACMDVCTSRNLKEELAWATDKQLQVISNIMLFNSYTTKKLKNIAILCLNDIVCIGMWSFLIVS